LSFAKQQLFDLVITDQLMPGLNGTDLIARLATDRYPARYLLISGYGLNQPVQSGLAFLAKPFTTRQLIDVVQRLQYEPTLPELEKEWRQAKARWEEAATGFKEIISDVPSGMAHPDGMLRIERAALNRRTTYELHVQAFQRYKAALQACGVLGVASENLEPEDFSE